MFLGMMLWHSASGLRNAYPQKLNLSLLVKEAWRAGVEVYYINVNDDNLKKKNCLSTHSVHFEKNILAFN